MVELLPVVHNGKIDKYIATQYDITVITSEKLTNTKIYLWYIDKAIDITDKVISQNFNIIVNNYTFNPENWIEILTLCNFYTIEDVEDIVKIIEKTSRKVLENKKVVLSYSGGKDSTTALIVLKKLNNYINFKLNICYTYMPYLEDVNNIKFIEYVGEKLGVNIEVLSPPKRIVLKFLKKYGLPYRRFRWCTYLKVRPLREFCKKNSIEIYAVGDRATECEKRWQRLSEYILSLKFISKREFRPIYTLTLLDVIKICKKYETVNPQYIEGLTRVSCILCPYKSLPEIYIQNIDNVEDPGLIETILRREFYKWYSDKGIEYVDFRDYHLWRFVPNIAKMFIKVRGILREDEHEYISLEDFRKMYSSIWLNRDPELKIIKFDEMLNKLRRFKLRDLLTYAQRETVKN